MPVTELEQRLPYTELVGWMAYSRIEPFGGQMDDYRAGLVAATIANVNRSKGHKGFTPQDFMPFATKQEKADVTQDVIKIFSELKK